MLQKTIREAKMSYYKQEFDNNRSNVRKMWNTINEILCKTKQKWHGLKSIISNGKKINDPIEIVNQFNDFFINVGPNLIKNVTQPINETYRKYLNKSILTSLHFTLIDENHAARSFHPCKQRIPLGMTEYQWNYWNSYPLLYWNH